MSRKSFTLQELAELTDAKLEGDPNYSVFNVADLESATAQDISFLSNPKYEKLIHSSMAGVIFVNEEVARKTGKNYLIHKQPSAGFQQVLEAFHTKSNALTGFSGVHASAVLHSTCIIGKNVMIGPHVVIDENAIIKDNSFIGAGVYIGPETEIGENTYIHPNVTIRERCKIGNRVIIQPGAVIGSCGFGYLTNLEGKHTKLNQVGSVIIEDDVEIGANTTIDRARFKETIIGRGSKIDNLVQIAHGVKIGQDNILISQTGIAGSSSTGSRVVMGGQSAIAGHLKVGDDIMIAARGGVTKSLLKKGKYGGLPAISLEEHNRNSVYLRNIETFIKKLNRLLSDVKEE